MTSRVLWLVVASLALTAPAAAQTTYASFLPTAGTPFGGFSSAMGQEGVFYDSAEVNAAGPASENVLRVTYRNGPAWDAQHGVGVSRSGIGTSVSQGLGFYMKWLWRVQNGHTSCCTYDGKFVIVGDGGIDFMRVICHVSEDGLGPDSHVLKCTRNIDGAAAGTGSVVHTEDAFHYIQVYVKSSSTGALITSINRSGATVTVVTSTAHGFATNDRVEIKGAFPGGQFEYEGVYTVTVTNTTTFTYTVVGTPTTPATGTNMMALKADAEIRIWVDASGSGFGTPSASTSGDEFGLLASATTWGATFGYGYFNAANNGTFNPPPIFDLGPLYIGDTFDSTWGTGGGGGATAKRGTLLGVLP